MNEAHELLQQMNWFLKPISNFILFLFTTKSGYFLMLIFLILYLIFTIGNKLRIRALAHRGVSKNYSIPFGDTMYIVGSETVNLGLKIISNVPILLGIFLFLFAIVGMSASFSTIDTYIKNKQKIEELQTVVKHLDKSYRVAKMKIIDYNFATNETNLNIYFYDNEKEEYLQKPQSITIKGRDIYFLSYVLNFEYSQIESGKKTNIAIPYKIFSEEVAQDSGILLNIADSIGVPYAFKRSEADIYGMDKTTYDKQLLSISEFMTDKNAAKKAGIRSFTGNFVHYNKQIYKGLELIIWVEQTGGIVLKEKEKF